MRIPDRGWPTAADIDALEAELRANVEGEVRFDAGSKAMYAVDASNYRQVPIGVVIPKTKEDVVHAGCRLPKVRRAGAVARRRHQPGRPMLQCRGRHRLVEVHARRAGGEYRPSAGRECCRERSATSCAIGRCTKATSLLTWGPDPATHNHCCFGGMIGNNSCGAHAQMAGKTDRQHRRAGGAALRRHAHDTSDG